MATPPHVLMARQPIFDSRLDVVAYELLYRSDDQRNISNVLNGEHATSNVLINAYTSIFDRQEVRHLPAFLNLTKALVESDALPNLSRKHIVVEVLENITIDDTLISALKRYTDAGYRIALDDFVYSPEYDPLLEMADIVKLDVLDLGMAGIREHVKLLARFNVTLLAEKIETYEELRECVALGFALFQGYFLSRPEVIEGRRLGSSEVILLQLMAALDDANIDIGALEALVEKDPALTFRLLRIVNSSAFALQRKINDIREALIYIGLNEIKKWVSLIALSGQKNKPTELTRQVMIIARMCELVAERTPELSPVARSAFLTGLLNGLDAILDISRDSLLAQISVTDAITEAIRNRSGTLGQLLSNVLSFCAADWDAVSEVDSESYQKCYMDSLAWSQETMELIED